MKNPICKLTHFNLTNKRVLLRADLNVPLINGAIADDFRLRALMPTLDYLINHNATVIIATHLARPQGKYNPSLSTKLLLTWFEKNNYIIIFESDLSTVAQTTYNPGSIVLLENMRFFPGEENHDRQLAQQLASCADYYVNDAFGTLHRNDVSVSLVTEYFPDDKKTIGFLIEKELHELNALKHNPAPPFLLIIGGGKVDTKLSLIAGMLDSVTAVMLCPAVVFTFLKSQNQAIGKSLVDDASLTAARDILQQAKRKNIPLLFPCDYQIANKTVNGPLSIIDAHAFTQDALGVSIGPKTVHEWTGIISTAKTIFFNAAMGFAQRPETLTGLQALLQAVAQSSAHSVVGGGDSVAAVERFGLTHHISFLSTGGGATLAYLSGQALPGLNYL